MLARSAALLWLQPASAHDPRAEFSGGTLVTFEFTDGSPMAFSAARLYAPNSTIPWLETTTDRAGRIGFLPDRDGIWRAEATDSEGHTLSVTMSLSGGVPAGSGKSLPDGLVALSLVLNLILASVIVGRWRRKKRPDREAGT